MSNDPFAFIGSNGYHQQQQLDYHQENNYPNNYSPQPTPNYNMATQANQQKQYPSAHFNYYESQHSHSTHNQSAPSERRHAVATFGPGGMLITCFPFAADRYEIINGKSVPRTLNLSKVEISKVQVKSIVNDLFNGPLISSFTRNKASVLTLLVCFYN
jgi:hypothetical protein